MTRKGHRKFRRW